MAMNTTSLQINISKRSLCFLPLMDHQSTDRGNLGGYRPPARSAPRGLHHSSLLRPQSDIKV